MRKLFVLSVILVSYFQVAGQVNLQSGSAVFNLPIFDWKDSRSRLLAKVALDYSSGSGLKVGEPASNIGQGWSLAAGGVIARMQVGEPDDQKPREGAIEDITKYPPGYLYHTKKASDGCPTALTKYPIFGDKNHVYKQHTAVSADRELDRFSFNFNGKSGIFVVGRNNGDKGVTLGTTNLKIWFIRDETMINQGIRTTISTFYIQDENGLIYKFDRKELTKVLRTNYCDVNRNISYTQPTFKGGRVYYEASFDDGVLVNPYVVSSWYLTEIEDVLTHRKVTFNYVTRNINHSAGTALSHYREKNYSIVTQITSNTQTPVLASISLPDGHLINFNYGAARVDMTGDYAMESIDILYNSLVLSKYQLSTSYFVYRRIGNPVNDDTRKAARLCLTSVKRIGAYLKDEEMPYQFDYYTGGSGPEDIVAPPYSPFKDIWGYYNGDYSKEYNGTTIPHIKAVANFHNDDIRGLCYLRNGSADITLNPKPGYAKNGLLKQVISPSGGMVQFEYAQNEAIVNGQLRTVGGVHVSRSKQVPTGGGGACGDPIVTNYSYTLEGGVQPSLWGVETPVNSMMMESYYNPESKYFYYRPLFTFGCDYRYKHPGIASREQALSITALQKFLTTLSTVMEIVSTVMTVIDIVSLCLAATPAAILAVVLDAIAIIAGIAITCLINLSRTGSSTVFYNADINGMNPLPSQFKRVEVSDGGNTNGRTVMEYTSPEDYPIWEPTNPTLSMKQRYAYWAYGLPKRTTIYNQSGNIVRVTENIYDWSGAREPFNCTDPKCPPELTNGEYWNAKCLVLKVSSQRSDDWSNPDVYNANFVNWDIPEMRVELYNISRGYITLKTEFDRVYKPGSNTAYLENRKDYTYNQYLQVKTITKKRSDGLFETQDFTYSGDRFPGGANLPVLMDNRIFTMPVVTRVYVGDGTTHPGPSYLHESVIEYIQLPNGDVKPSRTMEQRFREPQPERVLDPSSGLYIPAFQPYRGPGEAGNATYKILQTFTYNSANDLESVTDEGGRTVHNIYGYDNKYIIATVVNAVVQDKSAYTSFETDNYSGWTLNGTLAFATNAVTGLRSLNIGASNSLTASLNTSKAYRFSCWAANAPNVTSGTMVKSAPTINGFTYYEFNIPQGTTSVTVTGTGNIDEVRLYPQTARMRSVTYDPLVGRTAEADENSRIKYFEYDGLGRVRLIRDEQRNIEKMYEYNQVRNPSSPCNVYYNKAISEVFTKDDCGPNSSGSEVIYNIPANKYSSIISQAAADLLAEIELSESGQAYANSNGTCTPLYFNDALSGTFTKEGCPLGSVGTSVNYTVPANRYSSKISKADANEKAQEELDANGQAYANKPGVAYCVHSTTPVYEGTGLEKCNGGKRYIQVKDVNPSSSTYGSLQWVDTGTDPTCPPNPTIVGTNTVSLGGRYTQGYLQGGPNAMIAWRIQIIGNLAGELQLTINGSTSSTYSSAFGGSILTGSVVLDANGRANYSLRLIRSGPETTGLNGNLTVSDPQW